MSHLANHNALRHSRTRSGADSWLRSLFALGIVMQLAGCALPFFGGGSSSDPGDGAASTQDIAAELDKADRNAALEPEEPYWLYRQAELHLFQDGWAEARDALIRSLAVDPDYVPSLSLLSKIQYQFGEHASAASQLSAALSRNPDAPDELRVALALQLEAMGEIEAARVQLDSCKGRGVEHRAAHTFLTLRSDEFLQAKELAVEALANDPSSAVNLNNYGIVLLYEGEPERARESFLKAIELDSELAGALYNMAIVETYYYFDTEKGRDWFERYTQLSDDDPDDLRSVFGSELAASMTSVGVDGKPQEAHDGP